MKIATWNVRWGNKKKRKGIEFIFSLDPDVVSLQELPYSEIKFLLKKYPDYVMNYAFDCTGKTLSKSCFVAVMSRISRGSIRAGKFTYSYKAAKSLMSTFLYRIVSRNTEQHISPFLSYKYGGKNYCFYAARFSTAVGPGQRLNYLKMFPDSDEKNINILIGDLNIFTGFAINFFTGVFRNYSFKDMIRNERVFFDESAAQKGYQNPFSGKKTTQVPFFKHQLDHILLPDSAKIIDAKMYKGAGSDHKILFSEIGFN